MIELDFVLKDAKYVSKVMLKPPNEEKNKPVDLIFDTGASMTIISETLFAGLNFKRQDERKVTLIGVNGESEAVSVIIPNFEIGGVDLGRVRVVVGNVYKTFRNRVILGMNVLVWFNYSVLHHKRQIILSERKINTKIPRTDRFIALYPQIMSLMSDIDETDRETDGFIQLQ